MNRIARALLVASACTLTPRMLADPDIWWHLRTGQWMVQHQGVPRMDPFSTSGGPWIAYTWGFDLLIFRIFEIFGLGGLCWAIAGTCASIAHRILRVGDERRHSGAYAVCVAVATLLALNGYATPRPWWCSALGLVTVLWIVAAVRSAPSRLAYLAGLFAIWANLHVQFVYGLAVLALLLLFDTESFRARAMCMVAAVAATLINPYGYMLHWQVIDYARHASLSEFIEELRPPDWSEPYMWLVGLLGAAAGLCLVRRQGSRRSMYASVLLFAAALFLRSRRDGWVLAIVSSWILLEAPLPVVWQPRRALVWGSAGLLLMLSVRASWSVRPSELQAEVRRVFPVDATRHLPSTGAIFTNFDWGGYVMWAHPQALVTLDGRTNVHGIERTTRLMNVWSGSRPWKGEAELLNASAVLTARGSALELQLIESSLYQAVYEDEVGAVLVPTAR